MRYEFEVQVDLDRLNRGSRHIVLGRSTRVLIVFALLVLVLALVKYGPLTGLVSGIIAAGAFVGIYYWLISRHVMRINERWAAIAGDTLQMTATADYLAIRHGGAYMEVSWRMWGGVVKLPDEWLLTMYTGQSFIPLPLEQVPSDALVFIESEVTAHAGGSEPRQGT